MNSHSIPCLFPRYSNYSPIPPFGSLFTDLGVLLLHPYSLSSYNRASPFFCFLQRLRNSSGKGGNLFYPHQASSSPTFPFH
ncbi:hypothetical protein Goshw_023629 [Gossypium schwendimanii]|uniref:Uncharacterized protein n=1 Tax=Gossypium schwendimanii TaxID=34291 RepID=A0A7J9KTZ5_GOSSC|nr:hypothetical protein [Gossypium schwendimanii]